MFFANNDLSSPMNRFTSRRKSTYCWGRQEAKGGNFGVMLRSQSGPTEGKLHESVTGIAEISLVVLTPTHLANVMEYAGGCELFQRICNARRFSKDEVSWLISFHGT